MSAGTDVHAPPLVPVDPATLRPHEPVRVAPGELEDAAGEARVAQLAFARESLGPLVSEAQPELRLPRWIHEPTVLLGEPREARLRKEELFGPAAIVVQMDNEEAMVDWADDSLFQLGSSICTTDASRAQRVARPRGLTRLVRRRLR